MCICVLRLVKQPLIQTFQEFSEGAPHIQGAPGRRVTRRSVACPQISNWPAPEKSDPVVS